jgi:hypothetical protein
MAPGLRVMPYMISWNALRAKFGEHVARDLMRLYHEQSLGPDKAHFLVTILR